MTIPGRFVPIALGRKRIALVREDLRDWYLGEGPRDLDRLLREASRTGADGARPASGRGVTARIQGPHGPLVVKKYRRGGLYGKLAPDLYRGDSRMHADIEAAMRARDAGVPCARPAALVLARRAFGWVEAYLLTEEIPGAQGLADALADALASAKDPIRLGLLAIATIRRLHDAGIDHRDLNIGNLLVSGGEVFVIDFDGARLADALGPAERFANLARLDRSYVKRFGDGGPVPHAARIELLAAYCAGRPDWLADMQQRLAGHKRSLRLHRRIWPGRE